MLLCASLSLSISLSMCWFSEDLSLSVPKVFKVLELVFEALPQLVLQTYVGIKFGSLDPSSADFDVLLACSVGVALLGSGASCLSFEALGRYAFDSGEEMVTVASSYGVFTVLARSAQTASLVLSVALLGCAFKAGAAVAALLTIMLYVGLGFEAMTRDEDRDSKRCCSGIQACGGKYSFLCGVAGQMSRRGAIVWAALHALLVGASAAAFFLIEHVSSDYDDDDGDSHHAVSLSLSLSLSMTQHRRTTTVVTERAAFIRLRWRPSSVWCCCRSRCSWIRSMVRVAVDTAAGRSGTVMPSKPWSTSG